MRASSPLRVLLILALSCVLASAAMAGGQNPIPPTEEKPTSNERASKLEQENLTEKKVDPKQEETTAPAVVSTAPPSPVARMNSTTGDIALAGDAPHNGGAAAHHNVGAAANATQNPEAIPHSRGDIAVDAGGALRQHSVYRRFLQDFFLATRGPQWRKNTGWNTTVATSADDYCSWYGVECQPGGSGISLSLASNNLRGRIDRISLFSAARAQARGAGAGAGASAVSLDFISLDLRGNALKVCAEMCEGRRVSFLVGRVVVWVVALLVWVCSYVFMR